MRFSRLFSGDTTSRLALASAAAALVADDEPEAPGGEPTPPAGDPPANDPPAEGDVEDQPGEDGDEQDDQAGDPPAGDPPVDDAGAGDLSARDMQMHAAGRLEMADRIDAVFASDDVVGREGVAAQLLAADMPTDRILATLKKVPKGKAGAEMLANLATTAGAVTLEPGAESEPKADDGKSVWANAHKRLGFDKSKK